jgi:hypothetical protein
MILWRTSEETQRMCILKIQEDWFLRRTVSSLFIACDVAQAIDNLRGFNAQLSSGSPTDF